MGKICDFNSISETIKVGYYETLILILMPFSLQFVNVGTHFCLFIGENKDFKFCE